jgi:hypothetical protein
MDAQMHGNYYVGQVRSRGGELMKASFILLIWDAGLMECSGNKNESGACRAPHVYYANQLRWWRGGASRGSQR